MTYEEQIEEVAHEIEQELELWRKDYPNQTPGTMTMQDGFIMDANIQGIIRFLVEKGIAENEEEIILCLKKELLRKMQEVKPKVDDAVREQRLQALLPNNGRMDIPRGRTQN